MSWDGSESQLQLGQTTAATLLVKGKPDAIAQNAVAIRSRGEAMAQAGDALKDIDSGAWVGDAGEAFREKFSYEPGRWHDAAEAFEAAAQALDDYASMLRWAQDEAVEAIDLWEKAQQETDRAVTAHNASVDAANAQKQANAAAGNFNMVQVAPFSDPGEGGREAAREVLNHARMELALELVRVVTVLQNRADEAPEQSMWADIGDAFGAAFDFVVDFGQGLWDVASGTAEFLWAISPHHLITDPENYLRTWEALGQTVVSAFEDPIGFAKQMIGWEHWQNGEPGRALGNIVGNILSPTKATGALGKAGRADVDTSSRAHDGSGDPFSDAARQDRIDRYGEPNPDSDWLVDDPTPRERQPGLNRGDPRVDDLIGDSTPHGRYEGNVDGWKAQYEHRDRFIELGNGELVPEMKYPTAENGHPNGFESAGAKRPDWLEPGQRVDRFGGEGGQYAAPEGASWESRALPPHSVNQPYHAYEVAKPIPAYSGPAAPWFGHPGGGMQYYFGGRHTLEELLDNGYLVEVTA